ncbi:MAG: transketolase family protein [Eggerthellaceae bacterium]|nr:transketolase family protein [Eggerthellaceae bacterium]
MKIVYNGENDKTFKESIGSIISKILESDENVVYLDSDLSSCSGTAGSIKQFDRAINCGIAEANMAGIAAGLSTNGMKPIIHSFGSFASRRCYDQIFMSGAYAGNSITVIGTDPGVTAAFNGGTHMSFEDIALYRAIPGAYVFDPSDTAVFEDVLKKSVNLKGIKYIRVGRKNYKKLYEDGSTFEIGKGVVVDERGKDCVIFACGIMVAKGLEAAEILAAEGINVTVVDMFTIKPLDEDLVIKKVCECGCCVTAENHNKIGGLRSAVSECLGQNLPTQIEYVAVEDEFGEVGPQDYLEERFNLMPDHIVRKVKGAISRK